MSTVDQNALNSFTRGGQFLNNFVVMAKQNVIRIFAVALVMGLIVGSIHWWRIADNHDRYVMINEGIWRATLLVNPEADKDISVQMRGGQWTGTTVQQRLSVGHYATDVSTMVVKFKRAAFWGMVTGLGSAFLVFWMSASIGRGLGRDKHVRGAMLRRPREVRRLITTYNKRQAKLQKNPDYVPYEIAGVPYPFRAETQHTMFVGSTGSGKTQGIARIIEQIYERGDRAVVYEKMRSFVPRYYDSSRDIILNPLDDRCPAWDMFGDARNLVDFENFAQALVPSSGTEYTYFEETARTVFAHTAYRLKRRCQEQGTQPTVTLLLNVLTLYTDKQLHRFLQGSPASLHIDPQNGRTTGSIRSTLGNAIRSLGYLKDPEEGETPFSIRQWITDDDRASVVYMTSRDDMHPVLQPLLSMWMSMFTSALMSQPRSSTRSIWFILDELPSLNRLPGLESVLAEARQYGACFLLGIQLLSQLRENYGRDGADTILGLTRSKLVFNPGDPITAEAMADFVGKQEINRKDHSMSIGATELRDGQSVANRLVQELIIMPEELSQLPALTAILSFTGNFPVCRVGIDYQTLDGEEPGFVEDHESIRRAEDRYMDGLRASLEKGTTGGPEDGSGGSADGSYPANDEGPPPDLMGGLPDGIVDAGRPSNSNGLEPDAQLPTPSGRLNDMYLTSRTNPPETPSVSVLNASGGPHEDAAEERPSERRPALSIVAHDASDGSTDGQTIEHSELAPSSTSKKLELLSQAAKGRTDSHIGLVDEGPDVVVPTAADLEAYEVREASKGDVEAETPPPRRRPMPMHAGAMASIRNAEMSDAGDEASTEDTGGGVSTELPSKDRLGTSPTDASSSAGGPSTELIKGLGPTLDRKTRNEEARTEKEREEEDRVRRERERLELERLLDALPPGQQQALVQGDNSQGIG